MRVRVLDQIRPLLETCGLPYTVESGTRHIKIKICGKLVAIVAKGGKTARSEADRRVYYNVRSQIQTAIRGLHNDRANSGVHCTRQAHL
jgi:hypothetical protein